MNDYIQEKYKYLSVKRTETDGIILYTYNLNTEEEQARIEKCKTFFKENGYKGTERALETIGTIPAISMYHTILYNKHKDKISMGTLYTGFKYADRKNRYYPLKRKVYTFCYSKHMYSFVRNKPRILTSRLLMYGADTELISNVVLNINYTCAWSIPYKYMLNTKNKYEAISNYYGLNIPVEMHNHLYEYVLYDFIREYINPITKKSSLSVNIKINNKPFTVCV